MPMMSLKPWAESASADVLRAIGSDYQCNPSSDKGERNPFLALTNAVRCLTLAYAHNQKPYSNLYCTNLLYVRPSGAVTLLPYFDPVRAEVVHQLNVVTNA